MATERIPVSLVTGFLGAGKTTLLARLLAARPQENIAVIENELGAVSIDAAWLTRAAEVVELNDGCLCCGVRADLIRALGDFVASDAAPPDRVLIETSGRADPGPAILSFFADPLLAARYYLDAVVAVIDAEHGMAQLDRHREAREQVAWADVLLLAKCDRVDAVTRAALDARLTDLNPRAHRLPMCHGDVPVECVLDVGAFSLSRMRAAPASPGARRAVRPRTARHDDALISFVYESERAFDENRLEACLGEIIARHHADLLRYKGLLQLAGEPQQVALQGVHAVFYGDRIGPWPDNVPRISTLVFIGRQLPEAAIRAGLDACLT